MESNQSPFLDELLGRKTGVATADNSNLPPFDLVVPPGTDPADLARKITGDSQSPYLDEILQTTAKKEGAASPSTPSSPVKLSPDIDYELPGSYIPGMPGYASPTGFTEAPKKPEERVIPTRKVIESTPTGLIEKEIRDQSISSGKYERTFVERGLDTIYNFFGKEYSDKLPDPGKAQAVVQLAAKEAGIPLSQYRQSPELLEQAANAFASSVTLGAAPVVKRLVTGEVDYEATDTAGYVGQALGSLAGLYITPMALSNKIMSPVLNYIPRATASAPIAQRIFLTSLHDAAVLGPALGLEALGKAADSVTFTQAAGKIWDGVKSGAMVGTIFGASRGLFPAEVAQRLARITTGLIGLNAYRAAEVGGNPFTDRPVGAVFFDTLLDVAFLWTGLPRGRLQVFEKQLEDVNKKIVEHEAKKVLVEQIPEAELKKTQEGVLAAEKKQIDLEVEKAAKEANEHVAINTEVKGKTEQVEVIKKTGEVPIPEVFGRMPLPELTEMADKGVAGAKRELSRRAAEEHDALEKETPELDEGTKTAEEAAAADQEGFFDKARKAGISEERIQKVKEQQEAAKKAPKIKKEKIVEPLNELKTEPKPKRTRKKVTAPVDEITGELPPPLKSKTHPFRETNTKKVNEMSKTLASALRTPNPDIEVFTSFLHNEVNRYLNGAEDVQIEKVRNKLSELASKAESFGTSFTRTADFKAWRSRIEETAKWARESDRLMDKRSGETQLNMMIPVNELPEQVKGLLKNIRMVREGLKEGEDYPSLFRNKEVFDATGYWLGKDMKWRYEIDDSDTKYHPPKTTRDIYNAEGFVAVPLKDVLSNDKLYQAVPELKDVFVRFDKALQNAAGTYDPRTKSLNVKLLGDKETVIHELQHAVNDIVGSKFKGSNVEIEKAKLDKELFSDLTRVARSLEVRNALQDLKDRYDKGLVTSVVDHARDVLREAKNDVEAADILYVLNKARKQEAFENYMKDPGEMEARLASKRMNMTSEQRKAEPPWETLEKMIISEGIESDFKAPEDNRALGTSLYMGIDPTIIRQTAKLVKESWKTLGDKDTTLSNNIKNWLMGNLLEKPKPSKIYRGVPKGKDVINEEADYIHGTPWGYTASRGGKGAFGSPESYDVYEVPATKDAVYYRGGSLAGDPLERTRIKNAGGMSWDEILDEGKKLYQKDLEKEMIEAKKRNFETGYEKETVADRVMYDIRIASFETDLQNNAGIWRGKDLTKSLDKSFPRLRSYAEIGRVIAYKRGRGISDEDIPELKIIKNAPDGVKLYFGLDPTLAKKLFSAIKQIPSKIRDEKRIRLDEGKVPDEYKPMIKGANEWMNSFDDARDAKKFDLAHFLNRLEFRGYRAIHEQRGQLRNDLMKYGKDGYKVVQYIDAEQASSGLADRMYYEMRSEAFRDVPSHLTTAIDAVDLANRLTDIYGYKTGKEFIAPKGMSAANTAAVKGLLNYYMKMTPEERATAERASKTMSDHVKNWVDEMVEVGLIAADAGEVLKSHKYRKIKTLTVQDLYDKKYDRGMMLGDKLIRSTDSGIDFLSRDPITLLETDSRILYKETANRMFRRIQNQRTKNALKEFDAEYLENPFVRFRENDTKENQRNIPEGWIRDYYFKEGNLRTYYLEPDFALQLLGSGPHMSFELSRVLRNVFGVNLTRALTVSTSAVWATTRGLTMDIAHTFFSARRFKEVKGDNPWQDTVNYEPIDLEYERIYSRMAPKFLGQIGTDMAEVFSDVIHRGPKTGAYEKHGGVIPFLSMREQHYLGKGSSPPGGYNRTMDALSFWGQSMEMWNRVAVMNRTMKTLAAERNLTLEEAYKNNDLVMEATNVAVERLPYRQGGWLPKELDKIIGPFISAGYNASRTFLRAATENPVDFVARLSNIAIPTVALTIGLAMFAEEVDRDIPENLHVGSVVIPLPFDTFSFKDENGDKRYSLLRIPVDPNVAAFYNIFRLSTKKALFEAGMIDREPDYKAIVDSITRSLPVDSPMGPTVSAWLAYLGNVDTWRMNKIVEEPISFPRSNVEGMDKPERYGQLSKDIAGATGLSAPRLEAAARNFGFPNNEYAWLFGRAYDKFMSDLDPKLKEEHWAQSAAKIPGLKNLFAVTIPRSYRREDRAEMSETETFNRMIRNNKLAVDAKAFYWKGVGKELEIDKYIDSFEEKHIRQSLEQQREFIERVKPLPHRDSWVYNFSKSPEFKAEDYYRIWKIENSPEERAALNRELDYLLDAGYVSSVSSGRFWQKFDELIIKDKSVK